MMQKGNPAEAAAANRYYLIAWRWHFYAGLYVAPFLCILAVTGLTMLWVSWGFGVNAERMAVAPQGEKLALGSLQAAAEAAVPGGQPTRYVEPLASDRVALFALNAGAAQNGVALNPYTGDVMQISSWRDSWYDLANRIHGTLLLGSFGDTLIEIAASLTVVMIVTGLYLHWPRSGTAWRDALLPRLSARGRTLWKSIHGFIGIWISMVLVLFLISGLSWAGVWGGQIVQPWSTFPAEKMRAPLSDATHASMNHGAAKEVPWGLEQTPMPSSGSLAGAAAIPPGEVTIDSVAAFARKLDFPGRFQISFPADETGVWTISHNSMGSDGPDPTADRTIHIDRYSGNVLADIRYSDYSAYAKAMAWGIAFHEGEMGLWNLVLNTVFCLSVLGLSLSGLIMWWKRRPDAAGRLVAPPRPSDLPLWKGAALLVVALGFMFPLAGAAILAVLLLDVTLLRMMPGVKRALS